MLKFKYLLNNLGYNKFMKREQERIIKNLFYTGFLKLR
jgi:hypothetical protein